VHSSRNWFGIGVDYLRCDLTSRLTGPTVHEIGLVLELTIWDVTWLHDWLAQGVRTRCGRLHVRMYFDCSSTTLQCDYTVQWSGEYFYDFVTLCYFVAISWLAQLSDSRVLVLTAFDTVTSCGVWSLRSQTCFTTLRKNPMLTPFALSFYFILVFVRSIWPNGSFASIGSYRPA